LKKIYRRLGKLLILVSVVQATSFAAQTETPRLLEAGQYTVVINEVVAATESYQVEQFEDGRIRISSEGSISEDLEQKLMKLGFGKSSVPLKGPFSQEISLTDTWRFRRYSARFTTNAGEPLEFESVFDGVLLRTVTRSGENSATVSRIIEGDLVLDPLGPSSMFSLMLVKQLQHRGSDEPWTALSFNPLSFRLPLRFLEIFHMGNVFLGTEQGTSPAERYRAVLMGGIPVGTDMFVQRGMMVGASGYVDDPDLSTTPSALEFRSDLFPNGFTIQKAKIAPSKP